MPKRPAWLLSSDEEDDGVTFPTDNAISIGPVVLTEYDYTKDKSISNQQTIADNVR